jgi:hypothetical protein
MGAKRWNQRGGMKSAETAEGNIVEAWTKRTSKIIRALPRLVLRAGRSKGKIMCRHFLLSYCVMAPGVVATGATRGGAVEVGSAGREGFPGRPGAARFHI